MNKSTQLLVVLLVSAAIAGASCKCGKTERPSESNPCDTVRCGWGASCELVDGRAKCVCPSACTAIYQPVCGSDGKTYSNACQLNVSNCNKRRSVEVEREGEC